ncbi:MAG: acetyl-CoA carboxylase carboxyltransferase subunit alpha [Lachnospiraceae bacterium]
MAFRNVFKKTKKLHTIHTETNVPEVPEGLLRKCNNCKTAVIVEDVRNNYNICPHCHNYFRIHAYRRIEMILDADTFEEWDVGLAASNPLQYKGYEEKVEALKEKTRLDEAILTGTGQICGQDVVLGVCDGRFMMASMGRVMGEKITRAVERATQQRLPVILFACSGGARMQEGITSLMQMAKTAAALKRHSEAGLLYISVLTDPTTGGVTASFAMLGDIILAEPGALIGFAGPRVIEQTLGQKLPKGFQRAEFLLEHGFIDRITHRHQQKEELARILTIHAAKAAEDICFPELSTVQEEAVQEIEAVTDVWEQVAISRKKDRPVGEDYIDHLFDDFMEFHGDRYYKDDPAIVGGIATFHGMPITVIAQEKGRTTKESIERNFAMPSPDGYRKALRLMKQAEKFQRPVFCLVDTPGAFCGLEAEERGQGEAIARNIAEMSALKVPILSLIIGEGGSGGALAMATSDEVWMMKNATYSILSPEGFASILWRDSKLAPEAAKVMKLTALEHQEIGVVERVIDEPENFTKHNLPKVCASIDACLQQFLDKYSSMTEAEMLENRYQRFRSM